MTCGFKSPGRRADSWQSYGAETHSAAQPVDQVITTEFQDGQGLGNQLWVYAACRSIAEELNVPFGIVGRERFKGREFLEVDFGAGSEEDGRFSTFRERLFYDPELRHFSSAFDERVREIADRTKLEGIFQSEEYFFGDLSRIRRYVTVRADLLDCVSVPEATCVLNVRGGEYKRHQNLILPARYWAQAMLNMRALAGVDRFLIVTDDPRYAALIVPGVPILEGGMREDYVALHNARYLVVSNSSFAYFPVKTGRDDRTVIAPLHWARFGNRWSRWASPANLYASWLWQSPDGSLQSYEECLAGREATVRYYRSHYNVSTLPRVVAGEGLRRYVPRWLTSAVKRGLSVLLPRRFG